MSVKASPDLPSPVKAEKGQFLHPQITNCQAVGSEVKGEGNNCELAECAMRGRVSAEAHLHTRENGEGNTTVGGEWEESRRVVRKRWEERRKRGRVSQESPQVFILMSSHPEKTKLFLAKLWIFKTKSLPLRLIKHNFPFSCRTAASI